MILAGVSASVYALNRILLIPMLPEVWFLKQYVGDVLALPVYLPLSFYLAWRLQLIPEDFQVHVSHIVGASIIFSLLFEGIVPALDTTAVRDPWDVVAYFTGGLFVYIVGVPTSLKPSLNMKD